MDEDDDSSGSDSKEESETVDDLAALDLVPMKSPRMKFGMGNKLISNLEEYKINEVIKENEPDEEEAKDEYHIITEDIYKYK